MAAYAAQQLRDREVEQVVVTRPTVEAGATKLGFLKGGLEEKMEPWLWPFQRGFHTILGKSYYDYLRKTERIMACPLQYTQGLSFSSSIILADEFENATLSEIKMLLTRVGDGARIFLAGDTQQVMSDNPGFREAIRLLQGVPGVQHIEYSLDDIVRSEFCRRVLERFENVSYRTNPPAGVFAP
jgi:phosphate starvation-inducible PhoH-like protein